MSLSFARCLLRFQNGERLNAGEIGSKNLLKRFNDDGIITRQASGSKRVSYVCMNPTALQNYLKVQHDILSLKNYILEFETETSDGESSLNASRSTKTFRAKSLQGFFIKAFNTNLLVLGERVTSPPAGIELFIHQPEMMQIPDTALVIGIENPECFLKFKQIEHLFPQKEIIVIMRYLSNSPNRWLQTIPNKYLHFGDFDPAGVNIYIQEYRKWLPPQRCNYFIPENIEQLIRDYGLATLFDRQIHLLKNVDFQFYPEVKILLSIMKKYRKGMEQERLLNL